MLSLALRASELLFGIAPKSSQKGLAPDAVVWFASGEPNFPALLARAGLLRQYVHVLLRKRGDPSPRPFGPFPAVAAMLGTAHGARERIANTSVPGLR